MRTGYALRPVSLYNTVYTDSFTATIIIIIIIIMIIMIMIIIINKIFSQEATSPSGRFQAGPE